jgi:hypothetical protein
VSGSGGARGEEGEEKGVLSVAPQNPRKLLQRGDARWAVTKHGPIFKSAHHTTISVFSPFFPYEFQNKSSPCFFGNGTKYIPPLQ